MIIGIDACRNRSGGAKAHLQGLLCEADPREFGIRAVHVWGYRALLDLVPDRAWLQKHSPDDLERSLTAQVWWQATKLSLAARAACCDLLFTTDASTTCRFAPMVTLSQDMLSYEPGVMQLFGFTPARARLLAILWLQNRALQSSAGAVFLTRYASSIIQRSCGRLENIAHIPHGVGEEFRAAGRAAAWSADPMERIRCLYVSNAAMYKHQWQVVRAIATLRGRGHNVGLELIGGGEGKAQALVDAAVAECDPRGEFVRQVGKIPHGALPEALRRAHLFVFASSCENMPVTLLEAMAAGLPIACSNRGPMPEVLQDGGTYFDPESPRSIAAAIEQLLTDSALRSKMAARARALSARYTWAQCSAETWKFLVRTHRKSFQHESII